MTTIYLLALAGWLFHALSKIRLAKSEHSSDFSLKIYLSDHLADMLVSLIGAAAVINILPESEISNVFAFFIGHSSQSIIRDLMKKTTWVSKKDEKVAK
jgi:hypothetical protein